jgi:hypothetical protein
VASAVVASAEAGSVGASYRRRYLCMFGTSTHQESLIPIRTASLRNSPYSRTDRVGRWVWSCRSQQNSLDSRPSAGSVAEEMAAASVAEGSVAEEMAAAGLAVEVMAVVMAVGPAVAASVAEAMAVGPAVGPAVAASAAEAMAAASAA